MASNKLFSYGNARNSVKRSPFDLSKRHLFTAKVGELLPIYCKPTLPGDKWTISTDTFTRTQPVSTAAFTRINEYVDFFFIPYRLLWRNAPASFTQMTDAKNIATSLTSGAQINTQVPHVLLQDMITAVTRNAKANGLGVDRDEAGQLSRTQAFKLLSYLGYLPLDQVPFYYGEGNDLAFDDTEGAYFDTSKYVSLFPLLAYQKVYYDFYRNQQWEDNKPNAYNVDYMTSNSTDIRSYVGNANTMADFYNSGMLTLRYANFAKDLLFGLLPNAQYGDVASVGINGTGEIPRGTHISTGVNVTDNNGALASTYTARNNDGSTALKSNIALNSQLKTQPITTDGILTVTLNNVDKAIDAIGIRQMMATQKWREIANTGDRTYKAQIEKHFGVQLPHSLDTNCTYIGGTSGTITINEVVNQNLQAEGSQADIAGKGIGSNNGKKLEFECKEHGIIIGIYHATPQIDYSISGPNRDLQTIDIADFPVPEYDRLGMEPVKYGEFFAWPAMPLADKTIGYAPRYYNYKTDVDTIVGAFRETLKHWTTQFTYEDAYNKIYPQTGAPVTYAMMKVYPSYLDNIFAQSSTFTDEEYKKMYENNVQTNEIQLDQLLVGMDMKIYCVRNLDFMGLPY